MENLSPVTYDFPHGGVIYGYPSSALDIVRVSLSFEAGSFYQPQMLVADAASKLFSEGTRRCTPQEVAEFLDYRGIMLEKSKDTYTNDISVYMLRKYAHEMLPMLHEMLTQPRFAKQEFEVYLSQQRQRIQMQMQRTNSLAYRYFHQALYGEEHPLARYATVEDVDRLSLNTVEDFFYKYFSPNQAHIILSGGFNADMVEQCHALFGGTPMGIGDLTQCTVPPSPSSQRRHHVSIPSAQTTIRIGRLLPLSWNSPDYAPFMVLNTLLGGYFGSRLMCNIREDKGYTYGVYSATALGRDDVKFFLTMDVGNDVVHAAVQEAYNEMDRLCQERVSEEELSMVCRYMEGDFIRTVDGVFERGERFLQMATAGISEQFTDDYFNALRTVTPDDILRLAQQYLTPDAMFEICVGAGV
ncbi:MAG: insulinase family protein [Bacteroidales bacterium]|nr:insulinase family protein [Bacteroidales bacterium]